MKLRYTTIFIVTLCALTINVNAADGEDQFFVNDPAAEKYAVILVGASVSAQYEQDFFSLATRLQDELVRRYGYETAKVKMLLGDKPKDHAGLATAGPCRRQNIEQLFNDLSKSLKPQDQLTVFMFGHGSGYEDQAKFNIVGPDMTGKQFASLLNAVPAKSVIVINSTSASYDFSRALAGPGRVILSATRSAAEKYDTRFPHYLVEGIREHRADRDKNQRLSVLEAFMYARDRVQTFFNDSGRLATEHSALDDNFDGIFTLDANAKQGDGRLAEIAYLDAGFGVTTALSGEAARLKAQMDNLERSVFLLRSQKSSLSDDQYWQRMEPLLVELAQISQRFNRVSDEQN